MAISEVQRGWAAAYALGALDPAEVPDFERLLSVDPELRAEVASFGEVAAGLARMALPATPAPHVRARLLERIGALSATPELETAPADIMARVIVRQGEGEWRKTPFPGVEVKRLFVDPLTGMVTTLLKAAAGAIYPAHVHGGVEQVYVIDGDMVFDDHELDTGDYEVASGATEHSAIHTPNGCLAIIIHSPGDRIIR